MVETLFIQAKEKIKYEFSPINDFGKIHSAKVKKAISNLKK